MASNGAATTNGLSISDRGNVYGSSLLIKQEIAAIELLGIEAKNKYRVQSCQPGATQISAPQYYIREESDCLERVCCGPNRSLKLFVHAGNDESGPVLLKMEKPFHLTGCCFCRPEPTIYDGKNNMIGRIEDPCRCCAIDQVIYDANNTAKFKTKGSVCQLGLCCPCLADVSFSIKSTQGGASGQIVKLFDGCEELCLRTNKFRVDFPKDVNDSDKALLFMATMLLDLEYFEQQK